MHLLTFIIFFCSQLTKVVQTPRSNSIASGNVEYSYVSNNQVNISNVWTLPEEGYPVFYRYFRDRVTWFEADAVCQFHHAQLVTGKMTSVSFKRKPNPSTEMKLKSVTKTYLGFFFVYFRVNSGSKTTFKST